MACFLFAEGYLNQLRRSLSEKIPVIFSYEQSGDSRKRKFHGSSIVRAHLYVWAVCMVALKDQRIDGEIGKQLSDHYQELRKTIKGKDALIRILFKATRMLYRELVKEIVG